MRLRSWRSKKQIHGLGHSQVIFGIDSKLVVDVLESNRSDFSEFGSIISSCKLDLQNGPFYKVAFVKRKANEAAHVLARRSRYTSPTTGDDIPVSLKAPLRALCHFVDH
ncbi:hypothetical protein PTKIN_Ptkin04bG0116000 [Pterospermum kingtungense]